MSMPVSDWNESSQWSKSSWSVAARKVRRANAMLSTDPVSSAFSRAVSM